MKKLSKLLTMMIVIVAVITMSFEVNAGTQSLVDYLNEGHNINGMTLELTKAEKNALTKYINQYVDDATADSILADVTAVEDLIKATGAKKVDEISKDDLKKAVDLAKKACTKAGLTLSANTNDKTFKISKNSDGTVLTSGSYKNKIRESAVVPEDNTTNENTTTNTTNTTNTNTTKNNTTTGTTNNKPQGSSNGGTTTTGGTTSSTTTATKNGDKLLYTGYDMSLYVVALIVIVAIAAVAKKRV